MVYRGDFGLIELPLEVANAQPLEGGLLIPNKSPGRRTLSYVTLERNSTQTRGVFDRCRDVTAKTSGLGLTAVDPKVQPRHPAAGPWRYHTAHLVPVPLMAVKLVAHNWDSEADMNAIESVALARFERRHVRRFISKCYFVD